MKGDRLLHLIARIRDRMERRLGRDMERLGLADIAPAHAGALYALGRGPLSMSELAAALDRSNSTITALLDKLEARGYVLRRPAADDERSNLATLTEKGRAARLRVMRASRRYLALAYRGMNGRERQELLRLLNQVYSNLGETD